MSKITDDDKAWYDHWSLERIERDFPDAQSAQAKILQLQRAIETLQRMRKDDERKFGILESNFQSLTREYRRFVGRYGRFVRVVNRVSGAVLDSHQAEAARPYE